MRKGNVFKIVIILACIAVISNLLPSAASALDEIIRPSGFGEAGTRALGMGEAYCALSDDAVGVFWNPAGLAYLKEGERMVDLMLKANNREESTYDSIAFAGSVYSEQQEGQFDIQEYLENNLKAPRTSRRLLYNFGAGGIFSETYGGHRINQFVAGVGKKVWKVEGLSIGTKVRLANYRDFLNPQNELQDFTEVAAGGGVIYEVNEYFRAGLCIDNILKNSPYSLPPVVTLGVAVLLADNTVLALDGFNFFDDKSEVGKTEFRAGVEKGFLDNSFTVRLGTKNGNLNMGFGIQFTPNFRFDYAFMGDYDTDIQQHFVSGSVTF